MENATNLFNNEKFMQNIKNNLRSSDLNNNKTASTDMMVGLLADQEKLISENKRWNYTKSEGLSEFEKQIGNNVQTTEYSEAKKSDYGDMNNSQLNKNSI